MPRGKGIWLISPCTWMCGAVLSDHLHAEGSLSPQTVGCHLFAPVSDPVLLGDSDFFLLGLRGGGQGAGGREGELLTNSYVGAEGKESQVGLGRAGGRAEPAFGKGLVGGDRHFLGVSPCVLGSGL